MKFFFQCILVLSLLLYTPIGVQAISAGVSPSQLRNDSLLPGSSFSQEFTLSRADTSISYTVKIAITGSAAQFISIQEGDELELSTDNSTVLWHPVVTIPEDTAYKTYTGAIELTFIPPKEEVVTDSSSEQLDEPSSAVQLQFSIPIELTVQQQQKEEYTISDILIEPIEQSWPITVLYTVQNTGNVPVQADTMHLRIVDPTETHELFSQTVNEAMDAVDPFSVEKLYSIIDADLPIGQYWAYVQLYDNENTLINERKIALEVVPTNTIPVELTVKNRDTQHTQESAQGTAFQFTASNESSRFIPFEVQYDISNQNGESINTITEHHVIDPKQEQLFEDHLNLVSTDENNQMMVQPHLTYANGKEINFDSFEVAVDSKQVDNTQSQSENVLVYQQFLKHKNLYAIVVFLVLVGVGGSCLCLYRRCRLTQKNTKKKPSKKKRPNKNIVE